MKGQVWGGACGFCTHGLGFCVAEQLTSLSIMACIRVGDPDYLKVVLLEEILKIPRSPHLVAGEGTVL